MDFNLINNNYLKLKLKDDVMFNVIQLTSISDGSWKENTIKMDFTVS